MVITYKVAFIIGSIFYPVIFSGDREGVLIKVFKNHHQTTIILKEIPGARPLPIFVFSKNLQSAISTKLFEYSGFNPVIIINLAYYNIGSLYP